MQHRRSFIPVCLCPCFLPHLLFVALRIRELPALLAAVFGMQPWGHLRSHGLAASSSAQGGDEAGPGAVSGESGLNLASRASCACCQGSLARDVMSRV